MVVLQCDDLRVWLGLYAEGIADDAAHDTGESSLVGVCEDGDGIRGWPRGRESEGIFVKVLVGEVGWREGVAEAVVNDGRHSVLKGEEHVRRLDDEPDAAAHLGFKGTELEGYGARVAVVSSLLGEAHGDAVYRPQGGIGIDLVDVAAVSVDDDGLDGVWLCAEVVARDEALRRLGQVEFGAGDGGQCRRRGCLDDARAKGKDGEEDAYPEEVEGLRVLPECLVASSELVGVDVRQGDESCVEVGCYKPICVLPRRKTMDDFFNRDGRNSSQQQVWILGILLHILILRVVRSIRRKECLDIPDPTHKRRPRRSPMIRRFNTVRRVQSL